MSGARSNKWKLVAGALIALLASGTAAPHASAQTPDGERTSALTPPRVAKSVVAKRPEGTPAEGAAVDLELTIAADGKLTDAKVVASAGAALDAAALEAVRQFTFEPARKGDRAIAGAHPLSLCIRPPPGRGDPRRRRWRGGGRHPRADRSGAPRRSPGGTHPLARRRQARRRRHGHAAVRRRASPSGRRWPPRTARSRSPTSPPGSYRVRVEADGFAAVDAHRGGHVRRGDGDHLPPGAGPQEGRHRVRVRRHRQHRRAAARGGEADARARGAGARRRHARRSAARDRAAAGRRPPARPGRLHHHPRRLAVRLAGVLRGRAGRPHLPLRRADQLRQPAPARAHRPLPRQLLGALRPQDGRHHRRRDPRSQDRRLSRHGRRQPDRRVLHRRGTGRQARRVRPRRQAQLHRLLVQERRARRTPSASPRRRSTTTTRRSTPTAPRAAARCAPCSSGPATSSA